MVNTCSVYFTTIQEKLLKSASVLTFRIGFNSLYGPPWSNTILTEMVVCGSENKDRKKIILRIDHLIFIEHCSKELYKSSGKNEFN